MNITPVDVLACLNGARDVEHTEALRSAARAAMGAPRTDRAKPFAAAQFAGVYYVRDQVDRQEPRARFDALLSTLVTMLEHGVEIGLCEGGCGAFIFTRTGRRGAPRARCSTCPMPSRAAYHRKHRQDLRAMAVSKRRAARIARNKKITTNKT